MDYGFKPTTHGRAAIAACMAMEKAPEICRVAFGSGTVAEDVNLADVHAPLHYVADGTIGDRRHQDDRFYFSVQYSNYQHPGVPTFQLSEFVVYIKDPVTGEETDLLYGTMGSYPLAMPEYHSHIAPSVYNLPLVLVLSDDLTVEVTAPPGLVTYNDLFEAVNNAVDDAASNAGYRGAECVIASVTLQPGAWSWDEESLDGWDHYQDIRSARATPSTFPQLTVHPDSVEAAKRAEMCCAIKAMDGAVRVWCRMPPEQPINATLVLLGESVGSTACIIRDVVVPMLDWTELDYDEMNGPQAEYRYRQDFQLVEARHTMVPSLSPHKMSLDVVRRAGLCPITESMTGAVRLWARERPEADIRATLMLMAKNGSTQAIGDGSYVLPMADADTLGGIKIGSGLSMAPDGTASVDMTTLSQEAVNTIAEKVMPSEEEMAAMLDQESQPYQPEA